jgi:hypothetical protein
MSPIHLLELSLLYCITCCLILWVASKILP